MTNIDFYHFFVSPPSKAVFMVLKALELDFKIKNINIFEGEQKTSSYLKINPKGKVPAMTVGNMALHESRAIACYLCNKKAIGNKKSLYPTLPEERANVDIALYAGETFWEECVAYLNAAGVIAHGELPRKERIDNVTNCLQYLENNLAKHRYTCADYLTIADFFDLTTVEYLLFDKFDLGRFPAILAWIKRMHGLPYYRECNEKGQAAGVKAFQEKLAETLAKQK